MLYGGAGWGGPPVEHVGGERGFRSVKLWLLTKLIKSSLRRRCVWGFLKVLIDSGASLGGWLISILNKGISILSSRGKVPSWR